MEILKGNRIDGPAARVRRRPGRGRLTRLSVPLLLLLPAVVVLVWLRGIAVVEAVSLSLSSWDGFSPPTNVGLENFETLLNDSAFHEALLHNAMILAALPIWIAVPYGLAWKIHQKVRGWRFFRLAYFLPVVLSPIVIGLYYGLVLKPGGPVNGILRTIGLGGLARNWLSDPSLAMIIVILIAIWSTLGIGVLIFLGGLSNLDQEQVYAARIDGASNWQIQRHVVFWQLLPMIEFWGVVVVIASFTAFFPLIYALTRGGPGHATYVVDYLLYNEAFSAGHLGYAAAIGVALLIIIAVVAGAFVLLVRGRRG